MQNLSEAIGRILLVRDNIEAGEAVSVETLLSAATDLEDFLLDPWDSDESPALNPGKF